MFQQEDDRKGQTQNGSSIVQILKKTFGRKKKAIYFGLQVDSSAPLRSDVTASAVIAETHDEAV